MYWINLAYIHTALKRVELLDIKNMYIHTYKFVISSDLLIRLASNIDGLRRAPDSFHDQRYYSELILGFSAEDRVERYARFRLIPDDGSPETGLLSEDDQRKIW